MSSVSGSNPQLAVFLSYAREDAVATRRLAETLRAGGIEVWFDENELRGGDAWDRAIRKQIRDCALFVPVISASTQARAEGYFRLEWHLAEQRSLLIAKGRPFIVPVTTDETPERDALVPDAFLSVQWTRLIGGETPVAFVERVKKLLAGGGAQASSPASSNRAGGTPALPQTSDPRIPDYELIRKIGQGSYGDVWLARGHTGAYRAVKIVWRNRFADAEPFEREFRGLKESMAGPVADAGGLALLHVGRDEAAGFFHYVMELADDAERGRTIDPASYVPLTLKELRRRRGRLPIAECRKFGEALAGELAALHARGLVHRDIKPSNIIIVNGTAKLADIGLVTSVGDARTFVGTEGFVPPEGPGTPAADLFALGKVLYELATGLDRQDFPKLPTTFVVPTERAELFELNEILLRACEVNVAARYRDGAALRADFEALGRGRSLRDRRARSFVVRFAGAAVVLAAVLAGVTQWRIGNTNRPVAPSLPNSALKHSLAVLPFENLSPDPNDAYFADGMHEEVLNAVAKIAALKAIDRSAVLRYTDVKQRNLRQIAADLGVGAVVEGTVQRIGGRVRIAVQLVDTQSSAQLWSQSYNRELTDVFAIQSSIAEQVAATLQAKLTAGERARVARRPTANIRAYEFYLRAKLLNAPLVGATYAPVADWDRVARLLDAAVAEDPGYAEAYALLARVHAHVYFLASLDQTPARLARAQEALAAAERLAPDAPETLFAEGVFAYACEWKYAEAFARFQAALAGLPNNDDLLVHLGLAARRLGRWPDARNAFLRALEINPHDLSAATTLVQTDVMTGQLREAVDVAARFPGDGVEYGQIRDDAAAAQFEIDGDRERRDRAQRALPPLPDPQGMRERFTTADRAGDYAEAVRILGDPRYPKQGWSDGSIATPAAFLQARYAFKKGRMEEAKTYASEAIAYLGKLQVPPVRQPLVTMQLVRAHYFAGQREAARQLAAQLRAQIPGPDAVNDANVLWFLWFFYGDIDDRDDALASLEALERLGTSVLPRSLHEWTPVGWRGDPRLARYFGPVKDQPHAATPSPVADEKSIAVLPFSNLSGDKAQEYFSDGITQEILGALRRERDLTVPGDTSCFAFKGKSATAAEIGKALNVARLVEGSVRKEGNLVRITVTLTRAADGFSEELGTFTEPLLNIFELQEKLARAVVAQLTKRQSAGNYVVGTRNAEAYDLYLRARAIQTGGLTPTAGDDMIRTFEKVVELDPNYALAWARLAQAYSRMRAGNRDVSPKNAINAKNAAATALKLAPNLAESHLAMAKIHFYYGRDLDATLRELDEVDRLGPNDAEALALRADVTNARGPWGEELVQMIARAVERDPTNSDTLSRLGGMLSRLGRFAEAHRLLERARAIADIGIYRRVQAGNYVKWTGDAAAAGKFLDETPEGSFDTVLLGLDRAKMRAMVGDFAGAIADYERLRPLEAARGNIAISDERFDLLVAPLEARLGPTARANELWAKSLSALQVLAKDAPNSAPFAGRLAFAHAFLGEKAAARTWMAKWLDTPTPDQTSRQLDKADLLALLGDKEAAIAELRALHENGHVFGYLLRLELEWEPLRSDPKFQQLMKEAEARADAQPRPPAGLTPAAPKPSAAVTPPPAANKK